MKTLDISGSVEQKLAALAFTEKLKNYFKLYPHTIARDIREGARKAKISPLEMVEAFEKSLPQMMMDCLRQLMLGKRPHKVIPRPHADSFFSLAAIFRITDKNDRQTGSKSP